MTTLSASRSSDRQLAPPGASDQPHTPLFTKTALFTQEPEPASYRNSQSTVEGTPAKCAHREDPSHEAEAEASKDGARTAPAAHSAHSRLPVSCPREFGYDAEEQARAPPATMATSVARKSHPTTKWYANAQDSMTLPDDDDASDDEDLVQNQWASTRTSYAVERQARHMTAHQDEQQTPYDSPSTLSNERKAVAKSSSNVRGRVPVRSNRDVVPLGRQVSRFEGGDRLSDEEEHTTGCPVNKNPSLAALKVGATGLEYRANEEKDAEEEKEEEHEDVFRPRNAETTKSQPTSAVDRRTPHVSTFIAIDVGNSTETSSSSSKKVAPPHCTSSSKLQSRDEKLAELRQKKLRQLHKAREEQKKSLLKTKSSLAAQTALDHDSTSTVASSSTATTTAHSLLRAAKKLSNKKLVQNALEYMLLAGFSMEKERHAALAALAQSHCENSIVLLKSTKDLKFRALFEHHTDRQEVVKLFASTPGVPMLLTGDVVGQFFKYNSGKKEFVAIDSRAFTIKTDACALRDELVFKKKPALGKLL